MVERDKCGFIGVPWAAVPSLKPGSMGIMFDRVTRHLPPPFRAVVVSGTYGADPAGEAEGVVYHRIPDRADRILYRNLSRLQSLIPGFTRDYHFRSYYHRAYLRKASAFLQTQEVDSIVFPLYPQWAPLLRKMHPKARLVLWMQCEWLSAGPEAYGRYLKAVDRVVCCSDYIASRIRERYPWAAERLRTVPNGVDIRQFAPGRNRSRHQILYAGRLTPEKGAHILVRAFERIRVRYPDAQLVLAGPFWITPPYHLRGSPPRETRIWARLGPGYERMLTREALKLKSVFLPGHVPHKSLARMYRTASVFVHPCLWNEPFGMILAEAMASGLPVVASRCGGIPEVVEDGRSGILVDPGDVDGLVEAIERIFDNRDLSARMGAAARSRAESEFDWKQVAGMMAEITAEK